jgi:hypothetical protein
MMQPYKLASHIPIIYGVWCLVQILCYESVCGVYRGVFNREYGAIMSN